MAHLFAAGVLQKPHSQARARGFKLLKLRVREMSNARGSECHSYGPYDLLGERQKVANWGDKLAMTKCRRS